MASPSYSDILLGLPKYIVEGNSIVDEKKYTPEFPCNERIQLTTRTSNENILFFLDIKQSEKKKLKLTLHFQDKTNTTPLLRVDYNGRHLNPVTVNNHVPPAFIPFAGQWIEKSHIHYLIEGYNPLVWAIPLTEDNTFAAKDFNLNTDFIHVFESFGNKINLQTQVTVLIPYIQGKLL